MSPSDRVLSFVTSVPTLKYSYCIFQKLGIFPISNYLCSCYVQSTTLKIDGWVMK